MQDSEGSQLLPPPFSVAAFFRDRLAIADQHADTVPIHHFRLVLPPGYDWSPETRRLADEYNLAVHGAGRSASRGNVTHEQIRERHMRSIREILADHAGKADSIESKSS